MFFPLREKKIDPSLTQKLSCMERSKQLNFTSFELLSKKPGKGGEFMWQIVSQGQHSWHVSLLK
jgi:hypothetical protein